MPLVSVVIPTHNRANVVGSAVASVLAQTEQDFEIVVVDDGSTDATEAAVSSFAGPKVRYVRHAQSRGDAAARNAGILGSTGPYIAFLDDDDQWFPDKLARQLARFREGGAQLGLVHGARETVWTATGRSSILRIEGEAEEQLRAFKITTSTVMIRREAVEKTGVFDENIVYCSDYDLWIRIWRADYQMSYVDHPLARYFVHGSGLSGNPRKIIAGEEMLLQKHGDFFSEDPVSYAELYAHLGHLYCQIGDTPRGRDSLARSIRLNPRLSSYAYFLTALGGSRFYRGVRNFRALVSGA